MQSVIISDLQKLMLQGCKWSLQQLRRYLVAKHGIEKVKKQTINFFLASVKS